MFIICFILFLAGIYLFGVSFNLPEWQGLVFTAGILLVCIAMIIPMHILGTKDSRIHGNKKS